MRTEYLPTLNRLIMKTVFKIFTITFCIAFAASSNAQGVFEVESNVCDFGTVVAGTTGSCTVMFKNVGENRANMGAIRPSSDRIGHDWASKILEPGESDSFRFTVNTENLPSGEFKKSVLLIYDRTTDPITVWVRGDIE